MFFAALMSACSPCPQPMQRKTAWLLRFSSAVQWHTRHFLEVFLGLILATTILSSSRVANFPQLEAGIALFSAAVALAPLGRNVLGSSGSTFLPGLRTIFVMRRSSIPAKSWARATVPAGQQHQLLFV